MHVRCLIKSLNDLKYINLTNIGTKVLHCCILKLFSAVDHHSTIKGQNSSMLAKLLS